MSNNKFSKISSIIKDAKKGKMFILVDDEKRENEGDLVISSSYANTANINFMAKHGRGLICLAMENSQARKLNLSLKKRFLFWRDFLIQYLQKLNCNCLPK